MIQTFGQIRDEALDRWQRGRLDEGGVSWECRWQNASTAMLHACGTHTCETHVSLYCSLIEKATQIDDLLEDARLDSESFGTIDGAVLPCPEGEMLEAISRYWVRVLLASSVLLDDLQAILKLAETSGDRRALLSRDAPLDVDTLHCFINHVGKHGAKTQAGLHCWNHHAQVFFADRDLEPGALDGRQVFTAEVTPSDEIRYDTLLMPRLDDVVDTLLAALRNMDRALSDPVVLQRLADRYGTCLGSIA